MKEVLIHYRPGIEASDVLTRLVLEKSRFFVVSIHREENVDHEGHFDSLLDALNTIAERYQWPLIVSTHPRTRKKLEALRSRELSSLIRFLKPLGFFDYVRLQMEAFCVISDSGTITEESSILNFPAVTIRQAHERPEGMDVGTLIMSGLKTGWILEAIEVVAAHHDPERRRFDLVADYDTENVSQKVLRIILSYTDYVNRTVWHK